MNIIYIQRYLFTIIYIYFNEHHLYTIFQSNKEMIYLKNKILINSNEQKDQDYQIISTR